jgi:hypothetical protein
MLVLIANSLATKLVGEPDLTSASAHDPILVRRYATELTLTQPILDRLTQDLAVELAAVQDSIR